MRARIRNNKGQGSAVEYVLIFFLVVAIISGMTIYVQRVLQARTRDALHYMADTVAADYKGNFRYQYEPYYTNFLGQKVLSVKDEGRELQGMSGASIVDSVYNEVSIQRTQTKQLPPVNGL